MFSKMKQNRSHKYAFLQESLIGLSAITVYSEQNQELEIYNTSFLLKHTVSRCAFIFAEKN